MAGGSPGVRWVFTTRTGGVSQPPFDQLNLADHVGDAAEAVARNRTVLIQEFGEGVVASYFLQAEHGNRVATVDSVQVPKNPHDGLVTNQPGVVLTALAADCVPFVLADTHNGVVGAVHSGWRGVVANVAEATFTAMTRLGAKADTTQAVLGPTICQNCYPVDVGRAEEFRKAAPAQIRQAAGKEFLDVRGAVAMQLMRLGVSIATVGGCTFEDSALFSYRRTQTTGRHGAAVMLT